MKFKHGLAFPDADQYLFDRLPESGVWQSDALEEGLKHCENFRTAIDGGAHIGTWSLALRKYFYEIHCFEPASDTFEALLTNLNNRNEENFITAHNTALAKSSGYAVGVVSTKKDKKRSHTGARFIEYNCKDWTVHTVAIDDFRFKDVDFIKLDIEGGELDALKGAEQTLLRCKPVMVIEDGKFNERFGYRKTDTRDYLMGLGAKLIKQCGINYVWGWD